MAETLTPQQKTAVEDRGGKLLVSAAAGSGKTKVLVDRLILYIKDPERPANIDDFLIITYTKAAASELRAKIAAKLSEHIALEPENRHLQRQLQRLYLTKISTVHAFCADLLREYAYLLDLSADFRVADENEVIQLRDRAMEAVLEAAYGRLGEDPQLQAFVDTQGLGRSDALVPQIIWAVYESSMCHKDPGAWRQMCVDSAVAQVEEPLRTPWGAYLARELFDFLDDQIQAMTACAREVEALPGLEKAGALLRDNVVTLQTLRQSETWDQIHRRRKPDFGRLTFPKKADVPEVTERVKQVRSHCKETLEKKLRIFSDGAAQVLEDLAQSAEAAGGLMKLVEAFSEAYTRTKKLRRVLDFSDLEHRTLDLLLGKRRLGATAAAREIGKRFREIMVDEYQDSNGVQDAIFSALTEGNQSLFMVGDVKQSIYQFRLADPGIFLEKYHSYAPASEAKPGQGRKVLLSSNFRSGGRILDCANFVFQSCMSTAVGGLEYGPEEALREGIPHIPLGEPEVELWGIRTREDTGLEEAEFVARRIEELLDGTHSVRDGEGLRPIRPEDIVILLRSPGSVGADYVYALERRGIRVVSGAGEDLLLAGEIQVLRSLLQVISNPRQDIPLVATLTSPLFGFRAQDLAQLRCRSRSGCIYEALLQWRTPESEAFLRTLQKLRRASSLGSLAELFEKIFHLTRLDTVYSAMEDGPVRTENIQNFYQLAVDHSHRSGDDLDRFLEYLTGLEDRGIPSGQESAAGAVTVMSIHKSKGLEFPVVFLAGLSRRFNRDSLRAQVLCHKEMGLGLSCVDRENRVRYPTLSKGAIASRIQRESLSEELRVLYVAMTRPRDRLIMSYASDSLDKDIAGIAMRMDHSGTLAMTREVSCPGQWILYAALKRAEAGAFFALGERPSSLEVSPDPWLIRVVDGAGPEAPLCKGQEEADGSLTAPPKGLQEALSFRYPWVAATQTPSKQTATQQKGRQKDREAAEEAPAQTPVQKPWRKPSFRAGKPGGIAYGTAMHTALEHISYEACAHPESVRKELDRLAQRGLLTPEERALVSADKLCRLFATDLGQRLRGGKVLREFKFSILDDAADYGPGPEGEQVLLQGVVDCALMEEDGITVVDFKTDYVTQENRAVLYDRYAPQVNTYAKALSRIFQLPVKAKALYYFHTEEWVWLP